MRPLAIPDLGPLHEVWGDRDVMRWIGSGDAYSRDVEESERRLRRLMEHQEEHGFSLWAVVERDSSAVIGDCGLVHFGLEGPEIELAFRLGKGVWNRGYATEAAGAWIEHGLGELGLDCIVAVAHAENAASLRVFEKLGMERAGTTSLDGTEALLFEIRR